MLQVVWAPARDLGDVLVQLTKPFPPRPWSESRALDEQPNDVCERCGEEVFVPTHAVRCEWGCCILDATYLEDLASCATHHLAVAHACPRCHAETHRFTLKDLVARAESGRPYFTPRNRDGVRSKSDG